MDFAMSLNLKLEKFKEYRGKICKIFRNLEIKFNH